LIYPKLVHRKSISLYLYHVHIVHAYRYALRVNHVHTCIVCVYDRSRATRSLLLNKLNESSLDVKIKFFITDLPFVNQ